MYKSSNYRRSQPSADGPQDKYRAQAQHLQEAFPSWSNEDLSSLLAEVNGDIETAAIRIAQGQAEQWGSVHRKKDKKSTPSSHPQSKDQSGNRDRADFRGGRGGRGGGRGGPGRGGAARGAFARGAHHDTNGRNMKPAHTNGVAPKRAEDAPAADAVPADDLSAKPADGATPDWGTPIADANPEALPWDTTPSAPAPAPASGWANTSTPATWAAEPAVNGSASPSTPSQPSAPAPAKATKLPATSKLSWAQIARPQEKPTPPPAPEAAPAPVAAPASIPEPSPAPEATPPPQPEPELTQQGWEDPTTVQAPTWDDEPVHKPQATVPEVPAPEEPKVEEEEPPAPQPEPVPEPALPAQVQTQPPKAEPVSAPAPVKPSTPTTHARPLSAAHRHRFKPDQAVVMPGGNFGAGVEKVGMQFGSLSLGGDDLDASTHEPAPEPAPARAPEAPAAEPPAQPQPAQPAQVQAQVQEPAAPPSQPPVSAGPSLFPQGLPQQAQPSQAQQQQPPAAVPTSITAPAQPVSQPQPQGLPTSLSQPTLPAQVSQAPPSASNLSAYTHQTTSASQPSLSTHQLQQPQPPTHSQQQHSQYAQHGLPSHLEPSQGQQAAQSPQVSQGLGGAHSSYFRQPEAPYFHAATPPVSASQSQESPYGAFGQLGGQLGHQAQASHLGGFGGEYGYGESQRNFYDSYSGPTGFGNRNVLGHDDIKGLPGAPQQPHGAPGLPPSNAQPSQQPLQNSQTGTQAQPANQGPQQGYPPPLPYYYPYPQNQYYGSPYNSGYTVPQPFVKYPTVFQAGPPGPQSAPSPAGKQGPNSVQQQSPYGQSLYGQQHPSSAYDDLGGGYPHHTQHAHAQGVGSLPASEYGKHQQQQQQQQLYGGSGQGMQGFMGLGQSTGPSSGGGPPLGQRGGAGGSPEAAYKPYGGNVGVKDVGGGGGGAGVGVGQGGQPQSRGGVQQPHNQPSFYNQRFAAGSNAGVPQGAGTQGHQQHQHQPQNQGPQGHLGYPQGGSDGNAFYSYQPRQQQGYWQ